MKASILAIDTSTEACSVALSFSSHIVFRHEVAARKHAELVLPMVRSVLDEVGCQLHELDAIAFARGPGAFTGLRIAAGVVQGLAYGAGLPVISISTLAVMAHRTFRERGWSSVHCAIDARMSEVYWGSFHMPALGQVERIGKEVVCAPSNVRSLAGLPTLSSAWAGVGSGWVYRDALCSQVGEIKEIWQEGLPHSIDLMHLSQTAWDRGECLTAAEAHPVYLRDNVVQVKTSA